MYRLLKISSYILRVEIISQNLVRSLDYCNGHIFQQLFLEIVILAKPFKELGCDTSDSKKYSSDFQGLQIVFLSQIRTTRAVSSLFLQVYILWLVQTRLDSYGIVIHSNRCAYMHAAHTYKRAVTCDVTYSTCRNLTRIHQSSIVLYHQQFFRFCKSLYVAVPTRAYESIYAYLSSKLRRKTSNMQYVLSIRVYI